MQKELDPSEKKHPFQASWTWFIAAPFYHLEKALYRRFNRKKSREKKKVPTIELPAASREGIVCNIVGGLGDHLISLAFLDRLAAIEPRHIWILSQRESIARWLFQNKERYTVIIGNNNRLDTSKNFGAGFRLTQAARPMEGFVPPPYIKEPAKDRVDELLYRHSPWLNGLAASSGMVEGLDRYSVLAKGMGFSFDQDCLCDLRPRPEAEAILKRHNLKPGVYITIGGGVDDVFSRSKEAGPGHRTTKQLPPSTWESIITWIRSELPEVTLVRVGRSSLKEPLPSDLDLSDQTDLDELSWLLKSALFHVDVEGGLVHLAHHLGTRSLVFFGSTPLQFFGYRKNINVHNGQCTNCFFLTDKWMVSCLRGFELPLCTSSYDEKAVREGIRALAGGENDGKKESRSDA